VRSQLLDSERQLKIPFVKNSCVVYASFSSINGQITKVSKSFKNIFGIEEDFILGKTINKLIPKALCGVHDDLMNNFKNKGTMNIITKGNRWDTTNFKDKKGIFWVYSVEK